MSAIANKANELFIGSGVTTVGKLITKELSNLPGIEKFPENLKDQSLSPQQTFSLPENYFSEGQKCGVPMNTLIAVAEKIMDFKFEILREAVKATGPSFSI